MQLTDDVLVDVEKGDCAADRCCLDDAITWDEDCWSGVRATEAGMGRDEEGDRDGCHGGSKTQRGVSEERGGHGEGRMDGHGGRRGKMAKRLGAHTPSLWCSSEIGYRHAAPI